MGTPWDSKAQDGEIAVQTDTQSLRNELLVITSVKPWEIDQLTPGVIAGSSSIPSSEHHQVGGLRSRPHVVLRFYHPLSSVLV